MTHAFYTCDHNMGAGQTLKEVLRHIMPNISMEKVLRLEFSEVEEDMEYPAVWFTAAFLLAIWERRNKPSRIRNYEIRAEIEGKVALLRETRYDEYVENLKGMCENIQIA